MTATRTINSSLNPAFVTRRRRAGQRILTALRVLLALSFTGSGLMKLGGAESMVTLFADIGAGQWLRHLVGVLEIAGGIGLLIPLIAAAAAVGLAALMTGAFVTHAALLDGAPALEVVYLVVLAAIVHDRNEVIRSLATRVRR